MATQYSRRKMHIAGLFLIIFEKYDDYCKVQVLFSSRIKIEHKSAEYLKSYLSFNNSTCEKLSTQHSFILFQNNSSKLFFLLKQFYFSVQLEVKI